MLSKAKAYFIAADGKRETPVPHQHHSNEEEVVTNSNLTLNSGFQLLCS